MGQLVSRQAPPSRLSFDQTPSLPRKHHSKRERTSYVAVDDGQAPRKSVHWDKTSIRTSRATDARGGTPRFNALKQVDGNVGTPRRQPKYGRGKTSAESVRTRHDRHQNVRKVDTPQTKARTKEHNHHARANTSKSDPQQKQILQTKQCIICTDTRSLHRFPDHPPTEACSHDSDVCRRCLRTWIQSEFSSKIWNEINCPICAARMHYADIREFAPGEVFRRYDKLTTKAKYDSIPNHTWCLARNCKSGQIHPPGTAKFRCKTCKKSHCVTHGVAWHKGETCAEYDYRKNKHIKKEEEVASKRLIKETTKKCPGCKRNIEKSFGCDHMTCSKCKHEFCWQCLAPYAKKGVRRVIHRQGCEYYTPDLDVVIN